MGDIQITAKKLLPCLCTVEVELRVKEMGDTPASAGLEQAGARLRDMLAEHAAAHRCLKALAG